MKITLWRSDSSPSSSTSELQHKFIKQIHTIPLLIQKWLNSAPHCERWLNTCIMVDCIVMKHDHNSHIAWRRLQVHEQQSERQRKTPSRKPTSSINEPSPRSLRTPVLQSVLNRINCVLVVEYEYLGMCESSALVLAKINWMRGTLSCPQSLWNRLQDPEKYKGAAGYKEAFLDGVPQAGSSRRKALQSIYNKKRSLVFLHSFLFYLG